MWADLPPRSSGALFYSPVVDEKNPDHYKTFLQFVTNKKAGQLNQIVPDGCFTLEFGRCQQKDCLYVFRSQADKARHLLLIHKAAKADSYPDGFSCKFVKQNGETCQHSEPSRYKLTKHKNAEGHKIIRKRRNQTEQTEQTEQDEERQRQELVDEPDIEDVRERVGGIQDSEAQETETLLEMSLDELV